jgi:hypothetical protein
MVFCSKIAKCKGSSCRFRGEISLIEVEGSEERS